jgi:hypothetical protein
MYNIFHPKWTQISIFGMKIYHLATLPMGVKVGPYVVASFLEKRTSKGEF